MATTKTKAELEAEVEELKAQLATQSTADPVATPAPAERIMKKYFCTTPEHTVMGATYFINDQGNRQQGQPYKYPFHNHFFETDDPVVQERIEASPAFTHKSVHLEAGKGMASKICIHTTQKAPAASKTQYFEGAAHTGNAGR